MRLGKLYFISDVFGEIANLCNMYWSQSITEVWLDDWPFSISLQKAVSGQGRSPTMGVLKIINPLFAAMLIFNLKLGMVTGNLP